MVNNRNGVKWNREETILAFDLYCHTSRSKISRNNPDVINLANLLGRTPGSVALKMHNLAHYDPVLIEKNLVSMSHGSKLDEEVFNEFCKDWEELSFQAQAIRANFENKNIAQLVDLGELEHLPPGEYRNQQTKARVGQYFFRASVLNAYNNRCCVTGIKRPELLIASHIKPWKDSDEKTERTNPSNGLCLNALHDRAFDQGLITLDKDYHIIVSDKVKKTDMDDSTKDWFFGYQGKQISLPDKFFPSKEFIQYHNDMIFLG